MVDFNNETTIGTPALDVVKILILQRRYDVFEALESYNKLKFKNAEGDLSILRSRLFSLFLEIQASIKRRLKEEEYTALFNKIQSESEEDLKEAIYIINTELDNINLTKIDTRRQFDTTQMLKENRYKGLS